MAPCIEQGARTRAERSVAATVLSQAFQGDPLLSFLIPDPRGRARATPRLMRSLLTDARPFDQVWIARQGPHLIGVAAWLPPGAYPLSPRRKTVGVLRDLPSTPYLGRRLPVGVRLYAAIDRAHGQVEAPHWYLASLGCEPEWQRRGVGSALLEPVLGQADRHGTLAYLETSKFENVAWYERHGFVVVTELHVRGCPPMWTMRREPR